MEQGTAEGFEAAKEALRRFLEEGPNASDAAEAWKLLANACNQTGESLGEIHACIERAQLANIAFYELSNTANRLNNFIRESGPVLDKDLKQSLIRPLLKLLHDRRAEADGIDFSRMAWLAINSLQESLAREYVRAGLTADPLNLHLNKIAQRLHIE